MHTTTCFWYKQPWVWYILCLFTVAVMAATVMSVIAVRHTPAEIKLIEVHGPDHLAPHLN